MIVVIYHIPGIEYSGFVVTQHKNILRMNTINSLTQNDLNEILDQ